LRKIRKNLSSTQANKISKKFISKLPKDLKEQVEEIYDAEMAYGNNILPYLQFYYMKFIFFQYLVNFGANINAVDDKNKTLLHSLVISGFTVLDNLDMLAILTSQYKADVNIQDTGGRTPLFIAAKQNRLQIVKYLVQNTNVNINTKDNEGKTPIIVAAMFNVNLNLVWFLSSQPGIDVTSSTESGDCLLILAARRNDFNLVKHLVLNLGVSVDVIKPQNKRQVMNIIRYFNYELLKFLIDRMVIENVNFSDFIDYQDYQGQTILHGAAHSGCLDSVKILVTKAKADIHIKNNYGQTPIDAAEINYQFEVMSWLKNYETYNSNYE
jgi:ankyrin repeat protein